MKGARAMFRRKPRSPVPAEVQLALNAVASFLGGGADLALWPGGGTTDHVPTDLDGWARLKRLGDADRHPDAGAVRCARADFDRADERVPDASHRRGRADRHWPLEAARRAAQRLADLVAAGPPEGAAEAESAGYLQRVAAGDREFSEAAMLLAGTVEREMGRRDGFRPRAVN